MKTSPPSPTLTFTVALIALAVHMVYITSTASPTATGLALSLGIVPLIWITLRIFIAWDAYCEQRDGRVYQLLARHT